MTNGEKMQADFPDIRVTLLESYVQVMGENYEFNNAYPLEWWNAEYKEPSSSENPNKSEKPISSTIKNGISNRTIIYKAKESKDIQEDLKKLEKLNEPTTKNCKSCRHYGLHHEICNYCYKCSLWIEKEPTTKNDLGVEKIIDEIEKEFEKVDIPIMDKLTIFAKVQNALYKCAVSDNSEVEE